MANGSNKTTTAQQTAELKALGVAYGEGKDAWPLAFTKFAVWGFEGSIASATGDADQVKARVADFIAGAKGAQTFELSTIANKETEMRKAVELGEHCSKVKVDPYKLVVNARAAMKKSREDKKPTMQTLNGLTHIARRFTEKKASALWTVENILPMVKVVKPAAPAMLEQWKATARTISLITGLPVEKPTKAEQRTFAKPDLRDDSVKMAAAVVAYVKRLTDAAKSAPKPTGTAPKAAPAKPEPVKAAAAKRNTPVKRGK